MSELPGTKATGGGVSTRRSTDPFAYYLMNDGAPTVVRLQATKGNENRDPETSHPVP